MMHESLPFAGVIQDVRFAARLLIRRPRFTLRTADGVRSVQASPRLVSPGAFCGFQFAVLMALQRLVPS